MGLSFVIAAGLRQRSKSQVRVLRDLLPHFTVSDSKLLQPGGPDDRIYIRKERGGPVIPPGRWVFFSLLPITRRATVEIREPASTRVIRTDLVAPIVFPITFYKDRLGNTVSNSNSFVACVSVSAKSPLPYRCRGNVFTETNIVSKAFPNNDCFCGSTVLALSKCNISINTTKVWMG
jgi:hypothetical protein